MKTSRRTFISLAAVALLAAPFSQFAYAQDIKPRLIRFGYGLNEQSNQGRAVNFFAEQVAKNSGGKMKIRAIAAAALNLGACASKSKPAPAPASVGLKK